MTKTELLESLRAEEQQVKRMLVIGIGEKANLTRHGRLLKDFIYNLERLDSLD